MYGRFADPVRPARPARAAAALALVVTLAAGGRAAADEPEAVEVAPPPREVVEPAPKAGEVSDSEVGPAPDLAPKAYADPKDKYRIDRDRVIFKSIEDDSKVRSQDQNPEEYEAWNEVLLFARQFPTAELEKHARRDLTFADLFQDVRQDYKLDLVYFQGRLIRLRKLEPTKRLTEAGVPAVYEGWLVPTDEPTGNPVCVLITDVPPGLEPALAMSQWVGFAGYSFKLMRYESQEKRLDNQQFVWKRAPLLMGRSVTLLADPTAPVTDISWRGTFLPAVAVLLGSVLVVFGGLAWWFRRGDRRAKAEIEAARSNPFAGGTLVPPPPPLAGRGWTEDD